MGPLPYLAGWAVFKSYRFRLGLNLGLYLHWVMIVSSKLGYRFLKADIVYLPDKVDNVSVCSTTKAVIKAFSWNYGKRWCALGVKGTKTQPLLAVLFEVNVLADHIVRISVS